MPLYFTPSVGPFRFVKRISAGSNSAWFWVCLGWWLMPLVWAAKYTVLGCLIVARGVAQWVRVVRAERPRRS
ncbi:hypothetical protein GCM10010472_11090 [Pseudonocardia halophobica]|uniref:Uncharacterized protein n=1 Tax=Pseudonocardia halophobica TaxID=29401 RepID=A0A9W6NY88_9PSEU|nr:hypothetical protein [Pseudonocardia halophobica]GLL13496.1 hypothetical protein GCM10017577_46400 [Pseudonocardia halophobica]